MFAFFYNLLYNAMFFICKLYLCQGNSFEHFATVEKASLLSYDSINVNGVDDAEL
jgi:hypothetical protein